MQGVEGVEEFFLCGFFAGDELNIVHHQHINAAEAVSELNIPPLLDSGNQLVGEGFTGDIEDAFAGVMLADEVADGVHEVRFAKAYTAVDKQRVVGMSRVSGDGQRGGMGKTVAAADDERLEGVLRVQGDRAFQHRLLLLHRLLLQLRTRLDFLLRQDFHIHLMARHLAERTDNRRIPLVGNQQLQIVHHHAKHKRIAVKQRRNEVVAAQQRIVHYGVDFRAKHLACL